MRQARWAIASLGLALFGAACTPGPEAALKEAAGEINRRAPVAAGPGVQVDKAELRGKEFDMYYTLTTVKAGAVTAAQVEGELKKAMVRVVCNNKGMRAAVKARYTFVSVWRTSEGSELARVPLVESDCP